MLTFLFLEQSCGVVDEGDDTDVVVVEGQGASSETLAVLLLQTGSLGGGGGGVPHACKHCQTATLTSSAMQSLEELQ